MLNSFLNFIPKLQLNLYDKEIPSMKLVNNGESPVLTPQKDFPADQTPYLSGSSLPNNYQFVQLHFHWRRQRTSAPIQALRCRIAFGALQHQVQFVSGIHELNSFVVRLILVDSSQVAVFPLLYYFSYLITLKMKDAQQVNRCL